MELTFLGTSSMVPTKDRNHSGFLLEHRGYGVLFDCGEGIQRQFKIAEIAPTKINIICISHWHGDHVLGLPGLLQTLGACNYTGTLKLFGPPGTQKYMDNLLSWFAGEIAIEIEITEVESGTFYENEWFTLECQPLEHSVTCIGFALQEKDRRRVKVPFLRKHGVTDGPHLQKLQAGEDIEWNGETISCDDATTIVEGRRFAYVADTQFCSNAVVLAQDADVVVSESTHSDQIEEKAEKYKHLTAKQAAQIASQANAQKLVLTHFSQRYKTVDELEEEARTVFPNTICAFDFMKLKM